MIIFTWTFERAFLKLCLFNHFLVIFNILKREAFFLKTIGKQTIATENLSKIKSEILNLAPLRNLFYNVSQNVPPKIF